MILSVNGLLSVFAAYVNLITLASLLNLSTETTQRFAKFPLVKAAMLFSFAFSVIPEKMPCVMAVLLFFMFEVRNFVSDATEDIKSQDNA
jgi:hypothetical protein